MAELKERSEGVVFGIQRFSIHDGPGIRTTVFLKGCNVRCVWCHNPEGIRSEICLGYNDTKCIKCSECVNVCPKGCHQIKEGMHLFDRRLCIMCDKCVEACPVGAIEKIGKKMTVEDVIKEVKKDSRFYKDDGGLTLSGGEPLMQKEFSINILKRSKEEGINCALETNGVHPFSTYEKALPYVDTVLFDYKLTDVEKHKKYIGTGNEVIISNLKKLHDDGAKVLMRCPIVAGINDTEDHFKAIAEYTKQLPNLIGAEILSYHNLGTSKASKIGMEMEEYETSSAETVNGWKQFILDCGGRLVNLK